MSDLRRPCDSELYLSVASDGEGGPITVVAECDAFPGRDCGFRAEWPLPWGACGSTIQGLADAHQAGDPVAPLLDLDWGTTP